MSYKIINSELPFMTGCAVQKSLPYMDSINLALEENCSHFYLEGSSFEDRIDHWNDEKLEHCKEIMADNGKMAIMHGNYRNPVSSELEDIRKAAVKYACKEVDLASKVGAPLIVHGACIMTHRGVREYIDRALESFSKSVKEIARYAKTKNVEIWLENLEYYNNKQPFHTIFSNNKHYEYIFNDIPDNVKFIIDMGHENISSGKPAEILSNYVDKVAAISLSDNDGVRDTHSSLGSGNADYQAVLEIIYQKKWRGFVTVETRKGKFQECADYLIGLSKYINGKYRQNAVQC